MPIAFGGLPSSKVLTITTTSPTNTTRTYTVTINRAFERNVLRRNCDYSLVVNANPSINYAGSSDTGYVFTSYQWQESKSNISGATQPSYNLPNIPDFLKVYRVMLTYSLVSGGDTLFRQISPVPTCEIPFDVASIGQGNTQSHVLFLNEGSVYDEQVVLAGAQATPPQIPTRPDDTFMGWYDGDNVWDFNNSVACDLTLIARWASEGSTTAVATAQTQPLQIYPNPVTNEQLIISNEQLVAGDRIEVYSLSGALVKTFVATGAKSVIDLSALPTGNYVVKAGNKTAKVAKQ
jgi:uncharacterized repeat protein (TIGR02543 family)